MRCDYKAINDELRKLDWDELLSNKRVDEAWMLFRSRITSLTEHYVPLKRGAGRKTGKKNEWITKATVCEIKKRDALWAKYRKIGSERNYKAVRNRVVNLIRADKINYQRKLAVGFQNNPERFYGYIRRMQTAKDKVTRVKKKTDGQLTVTDKQTADEFCSYFSEVFVTEGNWNEDGRPMDRADGQ